MRIQINIVGEVPCPLCGAKAGHDDQALNFPNRPKVFDEEGAWWRCYNPACPGKGEHYYLVPYGEEEVLGTMTLGEEE